jgi:hypothetical protein
MCTVLLPPGVNSIEINEYKKKNKKISSYMYKGNITSVFQKIPSKS